jgi:hypothetical protein
VISPRQVHRLGGDDNLIERMVRRRIWTPVHPGVYVDHTGAPDDRQRRMAAVLYAWPAALAGESALIAHGMRGLSAATVSVAIDHRRRVRPTSGLQVTRVVDMDTVTQWQRTPPRLRLEIAVLQVASQRWTESGEARAVAVIADACQQHLTTADRLLRALEILGCLRGRKFLRMVLQDVATGTFSVLEHRYLTRVERAHGLPRANRQSRFSGARGVGYRDVTYDDYGVAVELDGRLGHEWALDRWADLERDLVAASEELMSVRLGWGAVSEPCRLAPMVGQLLVSRGWAGSVRSCRYC